MGFIIKGNVSGVGSGANTFPTLHLFINFILYIISDNIPAVYAILTTILKKYVL